MIDSNDDLPHFDDPRLAEAVERLSPEARNRLPYGAIRLDEAGSVTVYTEAERRLSGYRKEALGRSFFTEIAPCMDTPEFRGRIERARAAGRLDAEFAYFGDFDDADKELRVRVQSASGGGCWIFMQRAG